MASESSPQYTVLARRFRPTSFDEVIGQEHVGQAIQNAIRGGRVAHAYLFTGARGVGKTSTARIFAKALNCPNAQDGVPCNACDACDRIAAGHDVDVLEIDGASNRGIDDIRQLRANVTVRSMRSPYKVYIIDEVHMLTKEAFNALLKTLEEPPTNVKFVFCTTEPNKVPDTILSRCQRFDFGAISQDSIAERLRQIALAEGKEVDQDAVELVARRAAGSMRDSQSLFDQLLAFGSDRITAQDVHALLGTASDDRLIQLVGALIETRVADALGLVENALAEGVQIGSLSDQLLAYFRDLLVIAAGAKEVGLSAVNESSRPQATEQAQRWGLQTISAAMQILAETKFRMQRVNYGRALLELAIARIASLEQLDQIALLVRQNAGGGPAAPAEGSARAAFLAQQEAKKKSADRPAPSQPVTASVPTPAARPEVPTEPIAAKEEPDSPPEAQTATTIDLASENLREFWQKLLSTVPEAMGGHLKNSTNSAIIGPNLLEISFPKSYLFSKSYCERPELLKRLGTIAGQIAGRPIQIRLSVDQSAEAKVVRPAPPKRTIIERRPVSSVEGDAFVQAAVAVFSGQVVDVRPMATEAVESDAAGDDDDDPAE